MITELLNRGIYETNSPFWGKIQQNTLAKYSENGILLSQFKIGETDGFLYTAEKHHIYDNRRKIICTDYAKVDGIDIIVEIIAINDFKDFWQGILDILEILFTLFIIILMGCYIDKDVHRLVMIPLEEVLNDVSHNII